MVQRRKFMKFILSLCCLGFSLSAQALQTVNVQDAAAQTLITALQNAGLNLVQVSDQLATIQATGLACTSHSNGALGASDPAFDISTQECRVNVDPNQGPFSPTGQSIGEAHYVGDAITGAIPYGNAGGWDCGMMKCATGVLDVSCQINLSVYSPTNRFFCELTPHDNSTL